MMRELKGEAVGVLLTSPIAGVSVGISSAAIEDSNMEEFSPSLGFSVGSLVASISDGEGVGSSAGLGAIGFNDGRRLGVLVCSSSIAEVSNGEGVSSLVGFGVPGLDVGRSFGLLIG